MVHLGMAAESIRLMNNSLRQFVRYGIVGIFSNIIGYIIYLALTHFGTPPKLAMTLLYCAGVAQTFFFNKSWSFKFTGPQTPAFVRYATLYAAGYLINYSTMAYLIDKQNAPHEFVMAALMLAMPALFFLGQKFWVFTEAPRK